MAAKKTRPSTSKPNRFANFLKDERMHFTLGGFLVAFSLFLLLAFVSYFFTWKADQSFEWSPLVSGSDIQVENWSGKTGARLALFFLHKTFGISSFAVPFLLFIAGIRLFGLRLLPLRKITRRVLIGMILVSLALSYLTGDLGGYLGSGPGGAHGYHITRWLNAFMGKLGTGLLLLISILTFVIFTVEGAYAWFTALLKPVKTSTPGIPRENIDTREESPATVPSRENVSIVDTDIELTIEDTHLPDAYPEAVTPESDPLVVGPELEIEESIDDPGADTDDVGQDTLLEELGPYDPTLDLPRYKYPTLDLLEDHKSDNSSVTNEELVMNKNKIVETLGNYKIQIDKIKATIGPTVTLYEIVPAPGIRISKIKSLEDDIALSLSALGIRIIAPIPGKGTIGIEVPNLQPEVVSMRSILSSRKFQESNFDLAIALGKTISNETYVFDLAKMPHLLVAGATGQGKSVGLNAIITSLLYKKHPAQLKFVLIDPKKVELTLYSKIERHFLAKLPDSEEAIITDTQKVIHTMQSLTIEMESRYDLLKKAKVRNLKEYNAKFVARKLNPENGHRYLPYIVVVIDEFADLIMTAGREIETPIARLAQLARAIGIHLIIATQRPTTNIITGVIKANFPARIAFKVTSMIDSRTILDSPGANQLIGRGDMLLSPGSDMIRLQCAYIDIPELDRITEFIGSQHGYPSAMELPEYSPEGMEDKEDFDLKKRDGLFDDAARLVVMHQQGSTSLIQRKFSIGYNRAGRIMDQLEAAGIVGAPEGSKARQVMYVDEVSLEQFLNRLDRE